MNSMSTRHLHAVVAACALIFLLSLSAGPGQSEVRAADRTVVTYAGNAGNEQFKSVVQLSDGSVLVGGVADNLNWIASAVPRTQLNPLNINNALGTGRTGFLLHLSGDLAQVLHVVHFPAGAVEDVSFIKSTNAPGTPTGTLYISGITRDSKSNGGGYFIARLNNNFVSGVPTALEWAYNVWATGDHQTRQPWDVGSDGKVVYTRGEPYGSDWAAVYRLKADGTPDVVPDWRFHFGVSTTDGRRVEGSWTPASSRADVNVTHSAVIFKTTNRCDLRSWTQADYSAVIPDGNGATKQGRWPMDLFFNGPCNPSSPSNNGPGYTGYRMGANPTQRIGGIAIDRRNNHIYIGFSTQSRLPGGNPDFEPAVIAYTQTGAMKWWSRLYTETPSNSTPDQYVDGLAIDYSQGPATSHLVVLARAHGNNTQNLWQGTNAFQNRFTGTSGNIHISWLGKLRLSDGVRYNSTYVAEFPEGIANFGSPHPDPNLDGWPNPNTGWPSLNTTRCETDVRVDLSGAVYVTCVGRRTITTRTAYQKMPKPGDPAKGTWNDFVRVYSPNLNTLLYSTLLTGDWDRATGTGGGNTNLLSIYPVDQGVLAVGFHRATNGTPDGMPVPTINIPAWGRSNPNGESALLAQFTFDAVQTPPNNNLTGRIALQGRAVAANIPLTVELYQNGSRVGAYTPTTNAQGVFEVAGAAAGQYTVWVKHAHFLAVAPSVNWGSTTQDFGTLLAGDVNNDNQVTLPDFSALSATFNLSSGTAGYDPRADFNGDGSVTLPDFSLLSSNFNQAGAARP